MSNVKWTANQQKVIDLRNRNILVSAAAGSGKTAVLVERILHLVSEGKNPIDIDHLLVVTFTNAAAAEMRERIGKAIEEKIQEYPDNMHLQKQMTLLHNAQITTIHSFCLNLIRNHFNVIDLDPGFRMGDEAELKLLKSDVLEDVLEEKYAQGNEEFLVFMESYATGKSDAIVEDMVLKLYEFSVSYPWSEEWLLEQKDIFSSQYLSDIEQLDDAKWMKILLSYLERVFKDLLERNQEAINLCNEADGPYPYLDTIEKDRELLWGLLEKHSYQDYADTLKDIAFARLSAKRDEVISVEKREIVKSIREEMKKTITDIKKNYFFQPIEEMLEDIISAGRAMSALVDLTIEFGRAFSKEKEEKNLLDFSDLEHFALQILVKREDKQEMPSRVAIDLSEYYEEILIDEYQDSATRFQFK